MNEGTILSVVNHAMKNQCSLSPTLEVTQKKETRSIALRTDPYYIYISRKMHCASINELGWTI